jgi:hypothetical protein
MSGLNQRFTKPSFLNRNREFESHRLRQTCKIGMGVFFITIVLGETFFCFRSLI